ncbi:hypothetical protein SAMN05660489_06346 [Pseudomonas sp. LAMO17WK12:I10]|uniref:HvfC family RiPP maturation protein n=1 Tax=unclassified Pseudomonas TaxID=196821 RepID=UPI000BDBBB62|nr:MULTISPECIES: putative DNA-binding domain-containing protein [unclassified Pseudomonas]PXX50942.1 hypothetical protein H160_06359 [Pseudomonas sp. LAMO17WK12:I9]SNY53972.1 hypothetical protein SAMN05660489_06346 [Pseudomonas sp. LAMO17WK12:I10]
MNARQWQEQFAARIRDPERATQPSWIQPERMAIYEELFFNNVESFVSNGFPILHSLFDDERWQRLIRDFLRDHRCTTPYFSKLGEEFIAWLETSYQSEEGDPPFMTELAHYEWIELALTLADSAACGQLPAGSWHWSPLALPLAYRWPVHHLGPKYWPASEPELSTCLLVWRDAQEQVRFMQLTPFAYHLACRLREAGEKGEVPRLAELLPELAKQSGLSANEAYFQHVHALLRSWLRQNILLGALPLE